MKSRMFWKSVGNAGLESFDDHLDFQVTIRVKLQLADENRGTWKKLMAKGNSRYALSLHDLDIV